MKARLEFGLRDKNGKLWYSSKHWLEDFEFDQFPPVGLRLRFDVPYRDDDGRWGKCTDGSYYIDGGDPIYANVRSVEAHVCDETQGRITFLHVNIETEEGEPFSWPDTSEKENVDTLIEFRRYLLRLEEVSKIEVATSESGFTRTQSYFLQKKGCDSVADVANRLLHSFHPKEKRMVKSIERVLKQKWELMFCVGPEWLKWRSSAEKPKLKSKKSTKV